MALKDTHCAFEVLSVSIASGASLTDAVNLYGLRLFAVVMPSAWTAANLTFQTSYDGGTTWANMFDQSGSEITATADTSRCIVVNPTQFAAQQYLRIRSGTSSTAVTQSAARALRLILRAV